jgi:uncharacterized metal-binding protein
MNQPQSDNKKLNQKYFKVDLISSKIKIKIIYLFWLVFLFYNMLVSVLRFVLNQNKNISFNSKDSLVYKHVGLMLSASQEDPRQKISKLCMEIPQIEIYNVITTRVYSMKSWNYLKILWIKYERSVRHLTSVKLLYNSLS